MAEWKVSGTTRRAAWRGLALLAIASSVSAQTPAPVEFERSTLAIRTSGGEVRFAVELASTPDQLSRGLMFRDSLPPFTGMLFDFGPPRPVSMWMMNTKIPLDMLFIAADGTITRIAANTEPFSTRTIESGGLTKGVLEIAGGSSRMIGIKPGDRVLHRIFGTAD